MTFASGLRSILRQDPDVIMVGEIRDAETAQIAIQAAMTGHKVLSTVHTNDSTGAVSRFVEMGVEPFLVSSTLLVAVAQRLVRRACTHCAETYAPEPEMLETLGLDPGGKYEFIRTEGCPHCNRSGYKGRTGVYEVLEIDRDVKRMILSHKSSDEMKWATMEAGRLTSLRQNAARKVVDRVTTFEEVAAAGLVGSDFSGE
jgi:type IV pilus assembly protein PilB